ncbi:MAG TPA: DUF4058 family protein [Humisphaera sp.]|jgi:hypothetical protein|nr:DUF4058 family protein [Humisphaera sp.]
MNLLDHFHPPLNTQRHWHAFHNAWATYIAADLNTRLPKGYFAEPNVQFGIEIDVATFEESGGTIEQSMGSASLWSPPAPLMTIPLPVVTDVVEVQVFESGAGPTLAAAIELVSPSNKDRAAHREAFVSKCETYLQLGVGLAIVDVVTERQADLHGELLARLNSGAGATRADLYASAYRPVIRQDQSSLDIWYEKLTVGATLPTVPLWLRGGLCLPIALADTYERTCLELRILAPAR